MANEVLLLEKNKLSREKLSNILNLLADNIATVSLECSGVQ